MSLKRFPHIDLEAAMAAHDILMYIVERTGSGPDAIIRMYPLNNVAEVGRGDFHERQGQFLDEYLTSPEFAAYFREQWSPVLDRGEAKNSYALAYPDAHGEQREFAGTIYRVEWTEDHAVATVTALDVTDQKQAQRALEATQRRLNTVISSIPVVLFALDKDGVFVLSEGKGLAALGLQPGQVVGLNAFDVYGDAPELREAVRRALNGEMFSTIVNIGPLVYESWYAPQFEGDQVVGVTGVSIDITERMQVESERVILQEQIINAQAAALAELSTPLIPINDNVVIAPLIGAIDSKRAQQLLDALLQGISANKATVAILDITGVPIVDTQVANALIQAARAVKLLGAQVILTGIRPEVAQTLVGIGVSLGDIVTHSTLQSGVAHAMRSR